MIRAAPAAQGDLDTGISYIDLMVNGFFLVDVALNFRTAFPSGS